MLAQTATSLERPPMAKNLVMLFDGTWNKPAEFQQDPGSKCDTNVRRFYNSVETFADDGRTQVAFYDFGVGTEWLNIVRGGAFGRGLDEHIRNGYEYLCRNHETGDQVYVVGFSRGAYTARSLVGMIRNSGLLKDVTKERLDEAYGLYRRRDRSADTPEAIAFRGQHSREIEIEFLGVWDTVGALGVPLTAFEDLNDERYGFHDTMLSRIVKNAFHALALDEHREPYKPTFLTQQDDAHEQRLEQVWFAGAHSDVGGGYPEQPLSDPPLRWMQDRARECGLKVKVLPERADEAGRNAECLAEVHDSYKEFLGGRYAAHKDAYYRPIGRPEDGPQKLHWTLKRRLDECNGYAPRNDGLMACVARGDVLPA
jgi:uncharacterized protein (DUF2235 family)